MLRFALPGLLLGATLPALAAISVTITPERPALGQRDNVFVNVTLTNTGTAPERLLTTRTPFGAPEAPLFDITRDGLPVRYLGRKVKRAPPRPEDYLVLAPGQRRSARVELSSTYDMTVTGAYAVRYRGASVLPLVAASALVSNTAAIWIDGRLPRGTSVAPAQPFAGASPGLTTAHCSNAQQDSIAAALTAGSAMAVNGHDYLAAASEPGRRYGQWFGALDPARTRRVRDHFSAIAEAFSARPIQVDCACDEDYFAYVYPAQPYTIWVCNAFWTAPLTGTDSQGGTLLHELSHFDVVAGTDDHVYGQQGAAELARAAPERAVNNADSHEYFGENTPPLP